MIKIDKLQALSAALKAKPPKAKIGVLGSKDARPSGGLTNSQVGEFHEQLEFGSSKIPQRSFLRMPLSNFLKPALEKSGLFDKDVLAKVVAEKSLKPWVTLVAIEGVGVVADAFNTHGFGQWAPLAPSTLASKKIPSDILIETQQLRNSIGYEVTDG